MCLLAPVARQPLPHHARHLRVPLARLRVRVRVRVGLGLGFRVRVRAWAWVKVKVRVRASRHLRVPVASDRKKVC